jgi:hypothetical protein
LEHSNAGTQLSLGRRRCSYAFLQKAEEYAQKTEQEAHLLTKQALEAVSRAYIRRARQSRVHK